MIGRLEICYYEHVNDNCIGNNVILIPHNHLWIELHEQIPLKRNAK